MAIKFHKDPEPPALANIHLWFDAQDIGTLWQEDGRSTPVTASGDPIGAVDNKGNDSLVSLTQPTAAQRMNYDTTKAGAGLPLLVSQCSVAAADYVFGNPVIGASAARTDGITVCFVMSVDLDASAGKGWSLWEQTQHFDHGLDTTMPGSVFATSGGAVKSELLPASTLSAYYQKSNNSTIVAAKFSWDSGGGEATYLKTATVNGQIVASAQPASYFQLRSADESFYVWFQASNGAGSVSTEPVGASGTGVVVLNLVAGDGAFEIASNLNVAINALSQFTSTATNQGTLNSYVIITGNDSQSVTLFSSSQSAASLINVGASIFSIRVAEAGERDGSPSGGIGWPDDATLLNLGARSTTLGFRGGLGEMIVWDKLLDSTETDALETYITKKWGITWATSILPQSENIVHHFDFSDTSTLWRDEAGTLPVTASGDSILRVDNKGFDGTSLTQSASVSAPTWNSSTAGINGLGVGNFTVTTVNVSATIADSQGADLGDYSALIVATTETYAGARYAFGWGSAFGELSVRMFNSTLGALMNNFTHSASVIPVFEEEYAVLMNNDGAASQEVRFSVDADHATGATTSEGPQDGTNFVIGTAVEGTNAHDGLIAEIIVWTPSLTAAERDAAEAYVTDRWGITWA